MIQFQLPFSCNHQTSFLLLWLIFPASSSFRLSATSTSVVFFCKSMYRAFKIYALSFNRFHSRPLQISSVAIFMIFNASLNWPEVVVLINCFLLWYHCYFLKIKTMMKTITRRRRRRKIFWTLYYYFFCQGVGGGHLGFWKNRTEPNVIFERSLIYV